VNQGRSVRPKLFLGLLSGLARFGTCELLCKNKNSKGFIISLPCNRYKFKFRSQNHNNHNNNSDDNYRYKL